MPVPTRRERVAGFLRRWFRRGLGLTIAAVAAVWSFVTLSNLAAYIGFGQLSWMFPLCIDALAALGMDYWMTRSPAWKLGRTMALTAIAVSVAGNVSDWLLRSVSPLAALFGIIPPVALAAVMGIMHSNSARSAQLIEWLAAEQEHKASQLAARQQAASARRTRKPARHEQVEPPRNVTSLPPHKAPAQLPAGDDRVDYLVRLARKDGAVPTKRDVMAALQVGSATALKLTRTVREIVTTETVETEETTG